MFPMFHGISIVHVDYLLISPYYECVNSFKYFLIANIVAEKNFC